MDLYNSPAFKQMMSTHKNKGAKRAKKTPAKKGASAMPEDHLKTSHGSDDEENAPRT